MYSCALDRTLLRTKFSTPLAGLQTPVQSSMVDRDASNAWRPRRMGHIALHRALGQRKATSRDGGVWMLLVTGGAGFIGSNVVAGLNEAGRTDIVVNDALGTDGKWRNLRNRQLADLVHP